MSSVFYVNVEDHVDDFKNSPPSTSKKLKNSDSLRELKVIETRYNSERDIAYTPMEKTADGNIALHEVKSADNVSASDQCIGGYRRGLQTDHTLNYIDLDFNDSLKKNVCDSSHNTDSGKMSQKRSQREDPGVPKASVSTLYACIDFDKTSALKQISRAKT